MTVTRHSDGSITIQAENSTACVSALAIVSQGLGDEACVEWARECAKTVQPCLRSFAETEAYLSQLCEAVPLSPNDRRLRGFKLNVILNHFADRLQHHPPEFSPELTDEELEAWHREETARTEEALRCPPRRFALKLRGYRLPRIDQNACYYEEALKEAEKLAQRNGHPLIEIPEICVFFEEKTGSIQCDFGGQSLVYRLIAFRGVSREDIDRLSPQFLMYLAALKAEGLLPAVSGASSSVQPLACKEFKNRS